MNLIKSLALPAIATLVMSGCATMNEQECLTANWESVGYSDGRAAKEANQLDKHRATCIEHGVAADRSAYDRGYNTGIHTLCSEDTAFTFGTDGKSVPAACPADLMPTLIAANQLGMEKRARKTALGHNILTINIQIAELEQKIEQLNEEARQKGSSKEQSEYAAAHDNASKLDKLLYLGNAKLLKHEISEHQEEIQQLEDQKSLLVEQRLAMQQEIDELSIPSLSVVSNSPQGK
jgi:hypothetical protein